MMVDVVVQLLTLSDLVTGPHHYQVKAIAERAVSEIEHLRKGVDDGYRYFDKERAVIRVGHEVRYLNRCEFLLLERLVQYPGKLVTYRQCIDAMYSMDPDGGSENASNTLKVCLYRLRKKSPWVIKNVQAVGYLIEGYYQDDRRAPAPTSTVNGVTRDQLMAGR